MLNEFIGRHVRRQLAISGLVMAWIVPWVTPVTRSEELPVGRHPPALSFDHFPSRAHAVVWRNWESIPPERIAHVIHATEQQVRQMAVDMGLPPVRDVSAVMRKRGYITLIRRNWHLLPYRQLLDLLGMTQQELEFVLREDDFLFVKLGNLKPKCDPVLFEIPDAAARERVAEIRSIVRRYFGDATTVEPRFQFITDLSTERTAGTRGLRIESDAPRYIYSYFGVFGDPLLDAELDPYPAGLLQRLSQRGVNGVWLHVVLRDLAPGGDTFPEFGQQHERRLRNLRSLVARAKQYGIRVFLYINEPRAQRPEFFAATERHSMRGVQERGYCAMCTSNAAVRRWIGNALTDVFRAVPDLGGVFTITASENLTNCASHGHQSACSQCRQRPYAEIIGEINATIAEGVHRGNPNAEVLVWDWGWNGHGEAPDVIAALPQGTWLLSVSEWAKPINRGGVESTVGEYSISAVGPGPRAQRHWRWARQHGLKTAAKVQINTTNELLSLPYLPVLDLIAEHARRLATQDVDAIMLSWSFGGYPSPNLAVANQLLFNQSVSVEAVLDRTASARFGAAALPQARLAWTAFSDAYREYPFHIQVLYNGPQHLGPANLLYVQPTHYSATMVGIPYDAIDDWRGPYPRETLGSQFRKVADGWQKGIEYLEQVVSLATETQRPTAVRDLQIAKAAQLHFASAANQCRFITLRDAAGNTPTKDQRDEMRQLIDDEIRAAIALWKLARIDSRIGFEASNQYFYLPIDLIEKVVSCEYLRGIYED